MCAVKDAFSNRIVGYSIGPRMRASLAVTALNNAILTRGGAAGCIVRSDRGSQFRSRKFCRALRTHHLSGSMGRVGAAGDNAAMESFFVVLALVAALIVSAFLRPDPLLVSRELEPESEEAVLTRKRGAIRGIIAEMRENRPARIAVIAIILAQSVMISIMTLTPVHVVNEGGTVTLVGIVISLHVLGMFALAPVVGMLTDRYGNCFTIAVGVTILLVSLLLGIFLPDDMGWVTVSLVLLGVGWCFWYPWVLCCCGPRSTMTLFRQ